MRSADLAAVAVVAPWLLTDLVDVTSDLAALDGSGMWAVVLPFDGPPICARFAITRPRDPGANSLLGPSTAWPGIPTTAWRSSLDCHDFGERVESVRSAIAAGDVYQVNLTRRLSAPVPADADIASLATRLASQHPAPFAAMARIPSADVHVASASPERFLSRRGRDIWSSPIKGTAADRCKFQAKDRAENVMIVDLVRNDLGKVCEYGTVRVPSLLTTEEHPGLVHLVSTVAGHLRRGVGWAEVIDATFPPGSVTGAPKLAALDSIAALERGNRGVYCGSIGWIDAERDEGDLNVAIRTFWFDDGMVHFGTGGAITHDSTPEGEWNETELKASRLLDVAAGCGSTDHSWRQPTRRSLSSTMA